VLEYRLQYYPQFLASAGGLGICTKIKGDCRIYDKKKLTIQKRHIKIAFILMEKFENQKAIWNI
jgi:hypothetical protein